MGFQVPEWSGRVYDVGGGKKMMFVSIHDPRNPIHPAGMELWGGPLTIGDGDAEVWFFVPEGTKDLCDWVPETPELLAVMVQ